MSKRSNTTKSEISDNSALKGYTVIGSYEDKPTDSIFYFLHKDPDSGISGKMDCIAEYRQLEGSTKIIYQDGRMGSNGETENILNFSKSHLITGVNKIEDTLYWTDNLNRPRKIDVVKARKNEELINNAPTFQDIESSNDFKVYDSNGLKSDAVSISLGVTNNHSYKKNEHLYFQQFDGFTKRSFNGYSKADGIIRGINKATDSTLTISNKSVTGSSTTFLTDVNPGDYIAVYDSTDWYILEIDYITNDTELTLTYDYEGGSVTDFNLRNYNSDLLTDNAIISSNHYYSNVEGIGGRIMYADPEDAYSPLVSFGAYQDKIKYLDALAHQPRFKPTINLIKDLDKSNHLIGKFFQFKYRYVYKDGSVSAYSGISDVAMSSIYSLNTISVDNSDFTKFLENIINVFYKDDISFIDKIEIIARDGNDGEFFLVDTVNNNFISYLKRRKDEDLIDSIDLHFKSPNPKISFKNNGVYPFVSKVDSDKLQDILPKKSKTQTLLPNNRLAYGNVVDGYDNTKIYSNLNFVTSDIIDDGQDDITATLNVTEVGGPVPGLPTQITVEFDLSNVTVDGSLGDKLLYVDYSWKRELGTGGGPVGGLPRTAHRFGRFHIQKSIDSPTSIEDICSSFSEAVNDGNYILSPRKKEVTISGTWGNTVTALSVPQDATATYTSTTVSVVFTYPENTINQEIYIEGSTVNFNGSFSVNSLGQSETNNTYYKGSPYSSPSFKTGAYHDFGIIYYDETNRASFVNQQKSINDFNNGVSVYNSFYSERNTPQNHSSKLYWKIYHKPPVWATHYQWAYAGNSSVDEFIQVPIQSAYDSNIGDNRIYLGLGALKGLDDSYNKKHASLVNYNFVEGDRVRFIAFEGDGSENSKHYFKEYLDFPIISEDLYDASEIANLTSEDSSTVVPGYYITIGNPLKSAIPWSYSNSDSSSGTVNINYGDVDFTVDNNPYKKLIVEIYRPKSKGEFATFFEVGDKMEIINPGEVNRTHSGTLTDQYSQYFYDEESGIEVTAKDSAGGTINDIGENTENYASGYLIDGDVYTRLREINDFKSTSSEEPEITKLRCEDYRLSDLYNSNHWNKGRVNVVNNYSKERRLISTIYYSDVYSNTTQYNGLGVFDSAQTPYYDYNTDFGSIQHLAIKGDDLIIFHENKVCRVLVGKNIVNYADGDSNITLSKNILNNYATVYSGESGCGFNPESVVKVGNRFYFVDIKRGVISRLSQDGITKISDYGISTYLRDKGEAYIEHNPEVTTDGEFKIVAGYDPKYDEYVVTLPMIVDNSTDFNSNGWDSEMTSWDELYSNVTTLESSTLAPSETLSFNEGLNKWTSFYSFTPEFYGRINREFVTFNQGKLYKHNVKSKSNYNTFYGKTFRSYIDLVFNSSPSDIKTYNAISTESDSKFITGMSTNMGEYNSSSNSVIGTGIGFRKVDGTVSLDENNSILNGDDGCDFYKELGPGDLIKVYGTTSGGFYTFKYSTVKNILTKSKVLLRTPIQELSVGGNILEVIDYKRKEGINYSQIPFAPSKVDVSDIGDFQVSYDGDASNIFGLGVSKVDGFGKVCSIQVSDNNYYLGENSVSVNDAITGGRYLIPSLSLDFNYKSLFGSGLTFDKGSDILNGIGGMNTFGAWDNSVNQVMYLTSSLSPNSTSESVSYDPNSLYIVEFDYGMYSASTGNQTISIKIDNEEDTGNITVQNSVSVDGGDLLNRASFVLKSIKGGSSKVTVSRTYEGTDEALLIDNLTIKKLNAPLGIPFVATNKPSTPSISNARIIPAELALYSMDIEGGMTSFEGYVYDVSDSKVKFYRKDVTPSTDKFFFIVKEGLIDGEKLKGNYLKTRLTSHVGQSNYKFNLYAANVDIDKSELSNR